MASLHVVLCMCTLICMSVCLRLTLVCLCMTCVCMLALIYSMHVCVCVYEFDKVFMHLYIILYVFAMIHVCGQKRFNANTDLGFQMCDYTNVYNKCIYKIYINFINVFFL